MKHFDFIHAQKEKPITTRTKLAIFINPEKNQRKTPGSTVIPRISNVYGKFSTAIKQEFLMICFTGSSKKASTGNTYKTVKAINIFISTGIHKIHFPYSGQCA